VGVGEARDAEVHDLDGAVGGEHDVGGLDVVVDDIRRVGGDESGTDLLGDLQGPVQVQGGP